MEFTVIQTNGETLSDFVKRSTQETLEQISFLKSAVANSTTGLNFADLGAKIAYGEGKLHMLTEVAWFVRQEEKKK